MIARLEEICAINMGQSPDSSRFWRDLSCGSYVVL